MTKKTKVLRELTIYFMEKGKIMDNREYKRQTDIPIKSSNIIRILGSWGRIERMIAKNFPIEYELIMNPQVEEKKPEVKVEEEKPAKVEAKKPVKPVVKGAKK